MIQRDEADYAIDVFAVSYSRSQVAGFSPTHFSPISWITKFPEKLSPMWNLFGLFTKVFISYIGTFKDVKLNVNVSLFSSLLTLGLRKPIFVHF